MAKEVDIECPVCGGHGRITVKKQIQIMENGLKFWKAIEKTYKVKR